MTWNPEVAAALALLNQMTNERCPLCGAVGEVIGLGAFGYAAHCSDCYDADDGPRWRQMQGQDADPEVAVEKWLEQAREFCALEAPPPLRIRYQLTAKAATP